MTKKGPLLDNHKLVLLRSDELPATHEVVAAIEASGGQVAHVFGPRVIIGKVPAKAQQRVTARSEVRSLFEASVTRAPAPISETEQLGLEAWNLRQSPAFADAKAERPRDGDRW